MPLKLDSTNGSITLTPEDGSGDVNITVPRAGFSETDPVVGAVIGIVKADGAGNISAAVEDVDYATPTYVDAAVVTLIDTAPASLDTLNELAAALGDDANFASTVTTSIGEKLAKASNLSDLTDAATARTNLGLGSAATTASTDYATAAQGALADSALQSYTETDPVVGAITGIVKADGAGNISAAVAETDYVHPDQIGVTVQAYSADTLFSTDIGSTVQAYDADTAKYDDTTANFSGTLQNAGSNVVVDADIGSTVQAYDADTAKYDDTTANFSGDLQQGGSSVVTQADVDDTPVDGATAAPVSSNWAYDHAALTTAHGISSFGATLVDDADAAAARTTLGLGSAATTASTDYATSAQGDTADSAMQDLVDDTTPQLGGTLDANGYDIDMGTNTVTDTKVGQWDTAYGWGDHGVEGYLTGNQTITLSGDVTGSGTTSIEVTIADDSHNHIISNVDGLQTALDAKVAKSGDTMTGFLTLHADPTSNLHAATKAYVDEVAQGVALKPSVPAATTANLTGTYANGTAGVGATFTIAAAASLTIDGVAFDTLYQGLLIKDQTAAEENGRYYLSQVGDAGTAWIFTRCQYCDTADEIPGGYIFVQDGTANASTGWVMTVADAETFVVGTDDITVIQFSGAGTYTAGAGLDLTGTVFSHEDTSSQASVNNSGNTFIQDITLDTYGHITGITSATAVINDGTLSMGVSGTGLSGSASFTANDSDNVTFTVTSNATDANTAGAIVARDGSGNFSAGTITAALSGNSSTATKLATARTISLSGDVTGSVSFDGSANASITATVADDSHNHVISNVDGLQTALDAKQAAATALTTSTTFGGDVSGTYNSIAVTNDSHTHDTRYYTETEVSNFFSGSTAITGYSKTNWDTAYGWGNHASAGYLTGNQTITLSGDVTGSGTTSISVTVADDSHNHIISNVDGLQTALDGKQPLDADLTALGGLAKTDGNFIVGNGTTWVAESGSTVRASLGLGALATLSTVDASTITDNSVGAAELNVSGNGTSGQMLVSDGDGSFSWAPSLSTGKAIVMAIVFG